MGDYLSASLFEELRRRNVFKVGAAYLVLAWVVIQVTDSAVPALNLPEWVNSLVFYFGAIGFPFALFFAWAFEITPDGVKKESEINRDESITYNTGRKLDFAIIGLLIIGLGYFIWKSNNFENLATEQKIVIETQTEDIILETPKDKTNPASIAVLAFSDLSPQGDQEYFSDGISEEILNVLVKVKSLEVSSRTSAFQFKGQELGIPEIAKQLNVRHVLEGSVRKSGSTIRITAQLIDAQNDKHLWSETFDRPLDAENVFAIQDEIAQSIVTELSQTLSVVQPTEINATKATDNLSAYDLFLKARPLYQSRMDLDQADELLIKAIELDPEFSKAWEIRAALQPLMVEYGYSSIKQEQADALGLEYAQKTLSIESNSATAIAVIGKIHANAIEYMQGDYDIKETLNKYDKALEIEPRNASALNWRGLLYMFIGEIELGLKDFYDCKTYEPYYEPCVENYFFNLPIIKDDKESLQAYMESLNNGVTKIQYANLALLARNDKEFAFKSATNHPRVLHGWHQHEKLYQAYKNQTADHTDVIESIIQFSENNNVDDVTLNSILIYLGHYENLVFVGDQWAKYSRLLRQTTKFKQYIHDTGLFIYWKNNGFPRQCRPIEIDDFECD